jgi:hypothetical protein
MIRLSIFIRLIDILASVAVKVFHAGSEYSCRTHGVGKSIICANTVSLAIMFAHYLKDFDCDRSINVI